MKTLSCFLLTIFVGVCLTAFVRGEELKAGDVKAVNFLRINKDFCTAGQPSPEDLVKLKEDGITSILTLRRPAEVPEEQEAEKKQAEALGLKLLVIPVDGANPLPSQADEFLRLAGDPANRPMFVHCATANRVGAFWMIYRVINDGWDMETAEAEARKVGLSRPNLIEFARNYIAEHKK